MAKLGDVRPNGYRPFGMEDDDYVDIRDLVGKEIVIKAVEEYTNLKGESGVYIHLSTADFDGDRFTATKAVGIVAVLKDDNVLETLKTDVIECKVTKRPSRRDPNKTVIVLE